MGAISKAKGTGVVDCPDLSRKEPHRKVDMAMVIASGSLDSVMVNMLVLKYQEVAYFRRNICHFRQPHNTMYDSAYILVHLFNIYAA